MKISQLVKKNYKILHSSQQQTNKKAIFKLIFKSNFYSFVKIWYKVLYKLLILNLVASLASIEVIYLNFASGWGVAEIVKIKQ